MDFLRTDSLYLRGMTLAGSISSRTLVCRLAKILRGSTRANPPISSNPDLLSTASSQGSGIVNG